jgi:hypothetical protein
MTEVTTTITLSRFKLVAIIAGSYLFGCSAGAVLMQYGLGLSRMSQLCDDLDDRLRRFDKILEPFACPDAKENPLEPPR